MRRARQGAMLAHRVDHGARAGLALSQPERSRFLRRLFRLNRGRRRAWLVSRSAKTKRISLPSLGASGVARARRVAIGNDRVSAARTPASEPTVVLARMRATVARAGLADTWGSLSRRVATRAPSANRARPLPRLLVPWLLKFRLWWWESGWSRKARSESGRKSTAFEDSYRTIHRPQIAASAKSHFHCRYKRTVQRRSWHKWDHHLTNNSRVMWVPRPRWIGHRTSFVSLVVFLFCFFTSSSPHLRISSLSTKLSRSWVILLLKVLSLHLLCSSIHSPPNFSWNGF